MRILSVIAVCLLLSACSGGKKVHFAQEGGVTEQSVPELKSTKFVTEVGV